MLDSETIRKEFTKELKALLDKYDAELEYESEGAWDDYDRKERLKFYCPGKWEGDELVRDFTTFDVMYELDWL